MTARCDRCRKRLDDDGNRTATRVLCDTCYGQFIGLAAGFMTSATVEDAIPTAGWNERRRNQANPSE